MTFSNSLNECQAQISHLNLNLSSDKLRGKNSVTVIYDALRIFFLPLLIEILFTRINFANSTELSLLTSQTDIFILVLFNYHGKNFEPLWNLALNESCAGRSFPGFPAKFLLPNNQQKRMNLWIFLSLIILTCCQKR